MPTVRVLSDEGELMHERKIDEQHYLRREEPGFLGLTVQTWATIIGPVIAMGLLYGHMENVFKATDYLLKFARNSDLYNSAKTGIQFEQGMPIKFNNHDNSGELPSGVYKP